MKVGDMVNYIPYADNNYGLGVITGDWCSILYGDGQKVEGIRSWEETIEVISESR